MMTEEEVSIFLWMLADQFPRHSRTIKKLSSDDAQELLEIIDKLVPTLKELIEKNIED
jgi:hypothetical protein